LRPHQAEAEAHLFRIVGNAYLWDLAEIKTTVYWTTTVCPGTETPSVLWHGQCVGGLMFGCDEIYVPTFDKLADTELAHELAHCARMVAGFDPDRMHADELFWSLIYDYIDDEWGRWGW